MGRHSWSSGLLKRVTWSPYPNQLIHKCGFGKWLKFHVLALLRRTPLTRLRPAGQPVIWRQCISQFMTRLSLCNCLTAHQHALNIHVQLTELKLYIKNFNLQATKNIHIIMWTDLVIAANLEMWMTSNQTVGRMYLKCYSTHASNEHYSFTDTEWTNSKCHSILQVIRDKSDVKAFNDSKG